MPRYLDYRPGPAIHGGSLRDLASGNDVAALILANGQAQADAARRHGDIWGGAIDDISHQVIGGLTQYGQQRDAEQIARATAAATADKYPSATKPGPVGSGVPIDPGSYQGPPGMTPGTSGRAPETGEDHLQSILNSISPENRPQVLAQVDQAKASAAKVKAQQVEFETKAQALAKAKSDFEQSTADHWYSVAMDAQDHLRDPDGGISAITVGGLVSAGVPGADQIKQFGIDGAKAFAAAQGDPAKQAQIADAFRQQVAPLIQRGLSGGSLAAQKTYAETAKARAEAAKAGRPETPKPETRTIPEQIAAAHLAGDTATERKLIEAQKAASAAARDPEAAANRAAAAQARDAARFDAQTNHSYEYNDKKLEAASKPLTDQATRLDRLVTTLNQRTAQADALVAPELLTVIAGGAGSGLRINEAEIKNVKGGRSGWANIEAAVQHWVPGQALQLTNNQRAEIGKLLTHVRERITEKNAVIGAARDALIDAPNVTTHRRILADAEKKLSEVGGGGGIGSSADNPRPVLSPAEARKLPKGSYFKRPDGVVMQVP